MAQPAEKLKDLPPADVDDAEDDGDDAEEDVQNGQNGTSEAKKKKKKKKPKKKKTELKQGDPPRTPLSKFYPNGNYPEGETHEYVGQNSYRTTSEELRYLERLRMEDAENTYDSIRKAAEVHRIVRQHARKTIRPGMTMTEIADLIEDGTRSLSGFNDGEDAGIGFPTGLSVNHCAAHYSPNPGDTNVLQQGDVMKVDFGVHIKGRICDSAFTMTFEPTYDELLKAVRAATNAGVKEAGIDVQMTEIGAVIQEVMESYEVVVGSKTYPIKCIQSLNGHSIHPYRIHGDKSVPIYPNGDTTKMEEGEYFAIETFGTTGRGQVLEYGEVSHYAKVFDAQHAPLRLTSAKALLKVINTNFGTLPFCRRYLDRLGETKHGLALNHLVQHNVIQGYPPLWDIEGSRTAQFEHTILLRPTRKEVVSRGTDY